MLRQTSSGLNNFSLTSKTRQGSSLYTNNLHTIEKILSKSQIYRFMQKLNT